MNIEKDNTNKIVVIIIICTVIFLLVLGICVGIFSGLFSKDDSNKNTSSENNISSSIVVEESDKDLNDLIESNPSSNINSNESKTNSNNISSAQSSITSSQNETVEQLAEITKIFSFKCDFVTPEFKKLVFNDSKNGNTLPYRLVVPEDYNPEKKYPVILFLHGAGEMGTDNQKHINNIKKIFDYSGDMASQAFVICPQTNEWWNLDRTTPGDRKGTLASAMNLLETLGQTYSFDNDRIYVTGLSMGGYATWDLLQEYSDVFAAGMPICGGGDSTMGYKLTDIPIRIYHSSDDPTVNVVASWDMYNSIISAGGEKVEFIELKGYGHNSWDYAYSDREGFCWLFAQNKTTNPTGEYKYIPCFRVDDNKGNTIITDEDIEMLYYGGSYENDEYIVTVNICLKTSGVDKLTQAYKSNPSGEFTVYWTNEKLYTYKNGKIKDNLFVIKGVFNNKNIIGFYKTVKNFVDNSND